MASFTVPFSVHICTIWSFFHSILLIMCNLKGLPIAWTKMVWDCWVTWDRPLPTARYQKQQKLTWQPFSPWSKATWQLFSPTGHFYLSLTKLTVSLSQKKSAGNKDYHWRPKKTSCVSLFVDLELLYGNLPGYLEKAVFCHALPAGWLRLW